MIAAMVVARMMGGFACRRIRSGGAVKKEAVLARGIVMTVHGVPQTEGAQVGASAAAVARRTVADEARQTKAQQAADEQEKHNIQHVILHRAEGGGRRACRQACPARAFRSRHASL